MIYKTVLSACLSVLVAISGVCFGAENSNHQSKTQRAIEIFGKESVERFEQMFQTGEFDFTYCSDSEKGGVLRYAALMGDLKRVKLLVEKGADINTKDNDKTSILYYAIRSGNLELVQ